MSTQEAKIKNILEQVISTKTRDPGFLQSTRMLLLKSRIEDCTTVDGVVDLLEHYSDLVKESFGISQANLQSGIDQIKALS